ncbi:serine--tRNA ligase [Trichonephila clavipes]|nr:serine--tRNA ligase [Trichonephila clavipes]
MLKNVNVTEVKVCSTCLKAINKNSVPLLSVYNGFKYPPFPQHLKNFPLDLVTERLISPRIPFMQIRRLRHVLGQFGIYGQVINVPIEVNTMVNSLPRNIDDDHSITVHIKRKKIHKSNYLCGIVNKRKIKAWLQHLKDSPLYTYGITVDDSFFNGQDEIQDEIIYDEDGDNDISEQIPIDESLVAQQQTLMWNDEMYLTIAPGEGNVPVSLLFDEHAEELSFPQIYLGQFRTFRDGVNVTSFMMATSELRRSDRRGVTPQHLLYMAMKIMRIRIRDSLSIAFKHVGKGTTITKEQIKSEDYVQGCIESNLAFFTHYSELSILLVRKKKGPVRDD